MTKLIEMKDLIKVEMVENKEEGWNSKTDWDNKTLPPCWFHLLNEIEKQPFGEVIWFDETF